MFRDRTDAAFQLAVPLMSYKNQDAVVVAVPRGGVPMGAIIAKELQLPLDVILAKKISHPLQSEYSIGTITLEGRIITDPEGISASYIDSETQRIRTLLEKRYQQYYSNYSPTPLKDKIVLLIDDGIATGNTLITAVKLVAQQQPNKIVVAIPVSSPSALQKLYKTAEVNKVVCLHAPADFRMVGHFYRDFQQVSDEKVLAVLRDFRDTQKAITSSN